MWGVVMIYASGIHGMPVLQGSKKLGYVIGVNYSDQLSDINGLILDCGIRGKKWLDATDVDMIGSVAVISHSLGKRCKKRESTQFCRALSTSGERVGRVSDVLIDERTMKVCGLEISRGFLDDIVGHREIAYEFNKQHDTNDVIIVKAGMGDDGN